MKILITTDLYTVKTNGVVTSITNLMDELQRNGHDVRVLTLSEDPSSHKQQNVYYIGSFSRGISFPFVARRLIQKAGGEKMSMESLYKSRFGRAAIVLLRKAGLFRLASWFLKSEWSKRIIPRYIGRHQINMQEYQGQEYNSFAEFFARKRDTCSYILSPEVLISPCDGLLSIYRVTEDLSIPMKGSHYRLSDLVPDDTAAKQFDDGICLVFRLQASDYHHFCAFDDAVLKQTGYVPGELHSVQPIACEKVPVYRLNRRWWSQLETVHFGNAIQIEVGAMLVGGVYFTRKTGWLYRGETMGNFELAGSTIILLLTAETRKHLRLNDKFLDACGGAVEKRVSMGEGIGVYRN